MNLYYFILKLFFLSLTHGETGVSNRIKKQFDLQSPGQFYLRKCGEFFSAKRNLGKYKNAKDCLYRNIGKPKNRKNMELQEPREGDTLHYSAFATSRIHKNVHASKERFSKNNSPNQVVERTINGHIKFYVNREKLQSSEIAIRPIRNYFQGHNFPRKRRDVIECFKEGSCENNMNQDFPLCYCDSNCRIYNDCCHDYPVSVGLKGKQTTEKALKLNYTSCKVNIIPDYLGHTWRGYMFVSVCPKNETKMEIRQKCEETEIKEGHIPVTAYDGLVYKNEYCAKCHGVTHFVRWDLHYEFTCKVSLYNLLKINNSEDVIHLLNKEACKFDVFPPKLLPRPRVCWKTKEISFKDADNINECLRYQNPVFEFLSGFRNVLARNSFCINRTNINSCGWPMNDTSRFSVHYMSALFNFNIPRNSDDKECIQNENGTCQFGAIIDNSELDINLELLTNASSIENISLSAMSLARALLELFFPFKIKDITNNRYTSSAGHCHYLRVSNINGTLSCHNTSSCHLISIVYFFNIDGSISLKEMSHFYETLTRVNWTYIEKSEDNPTRYSITTIKYDRDMVQKAPDDSYEQCRKYDDSLGIQYQKKLRDELRVIKPKVKKLPERLEVIAFLSQQRKTIKEKIESFKLLSFKYSCTEIVWKRFYKETGNVFFQNIQIVATFVTMGLSSIFLFATLVIQKFFNLSNNIAGKVSEHLMISMMFSHLFFMFGFGANDYYIVCLIIGILSHYVWLCCFAWMSSYTITLLIAILKLKQNPYLRTASQFPVYNYIIGYGIPLLIVIPSAILELANVFQIGYAKEMCFPSIYPVNLVVFIGPISLSVLINVTALLIAGSKIYIFQQSIVNQSAAIATRSYWPVYLRFIIFSGLSWCLGIIAEATDQDTLRGLFILFAGSHGFLFSVSLLISRQVMTRLRTFRGKGTTSTVSTIDSLFQHNQVQPDPNVDLDKIHCHLTKDSLQNIG